MKYKSRISREQEREYIRQYQANRYSEVPEEKALAKEALDILIDAHISYVHKLALKEHANFAKTIPIEDLVHEGVIGLIKAIGKFKLERETLHPKTKKIVQNQALLTYGHSYIRAEIQTLFYRSNATHIPAHLLRSIFFNIEDKNENIKKYKKIARKGMKAESLHDIDYFSYGSGEKVSLCSKEDIQKDPTCIDGIAGIYSDKIEKIIKMLDPVEWSILQMRYGLVEGEIGIITRMPTIAQRLNITVAEAEKMLKRAKRTFIKNLKD